MIFHHFWHDIQQNCLCLKTQSSNEKYIQFSPFSNTFFLFSSFIKPLFLFSPFVKLRQFSPFVKLLLFSPFSKGGLRGISQAFSPFVKGRCKRDFINQPLFFLRQLSPFTKGGLRGISKGRRNLPQPLFYKEGSNVGELYKEGSRMGFCKGR